MLDDEKIRLNFAKRLELACKQKGLPDKGKGKQIADILKITPKAVSKWFNAETMPSASNVYVVADFLEVTPEWLMFGDANASLIKVTKSFQYPVLSTVQAGMFTEINLLNSVDLERDYEMISSQVKASANAFYLKIEGKSMAPRFNEGDLVLIDPNIYPQPGDFVAAINENYEATFKKYKQLAQIAPSGEAHFELIPLNDVYPTLSSLEQNIRIIGKAVEHRQCL